MINYLFLSEGTSDEVLIPIINGLILSQYKNSINVIIPNFNSIKPKPTTLQSKLIAIKQLYTNVDFSIIHRDADSAGYTARLREIETAIITSGTSVPHIPAIPVRMTESWLLVDHRAIFAAVGFGKSPNKVSLLGVKQIERQADPKQYLFDKIHEIADLPKRRRRDLDIYLVRKKIGDLINNPMIINILPSFSVFQTTLNKTLRDLYDEPVE